MSTLIYDTNWHGVSELVEGKNIVGYRYSEEAERLKTVDDYPRYLVFGKEGYLITSNYKVDLRAPIKIPYQYKNLTIDMVLEGELHKKPTDVSAIKDTTVYLPTTEDKLRDRIAELEAQLKAKG